MFNIETEKRPVASSEFDTFDFHIPEIMPDEYFSGYLERFSRANGLKNVQLAIKSLKNTVRKNYPELKYFSTIWFFSNALNISMNELIHRHTLWPLGKSLLSGAKCQLEEKTVLNTQKRNALPSNMENEYICRHCVEEDLKYWGFAYWRRSHAIPGIEWCSKHNKCLESAISKKSFQNPPSFYISNNLTNSIEDSEINKQYPFLVRYMQITSDFVEVDILLDDQSAKSTIINKMKSNKPLGTKFFVSKEIDSLMSEKLPQNWIKKYHPSLLDPIGYPVCTGWGYRNILTNSSSNGRTLINMLILFALLFEDTDEALVEIKNAHLNQPSTQILSASTAN